MKKVVLVTAIAVVSFGMTSCNEIKSNEEVVSPKTSESVVPKSELALADPAELSEPIINYRYVTAPSGLTLREFNNLQSEKLGTMPYGTKVRVLNTEGKNTMKVAGILGAMDEVEFNYKKGFAFNGYLSVYFPPERDISVKAYAEELKQNFPAVKYEEKNTGLKSSPVLSETLWLPDAAWHEAFITAQRLFDFPKEFEVPTNSGKDFQIVPDKNPKKDIWMSQLEITRKDDALEKISYVYTSEKFKAVVTITKEGNTMKLEKQETIE